MRKCKSHFKFYTYSPKKLLETARPVNPTLTWFQIIAMILYFALSHDTTYLVSLIGEDFWLLRPHISRIIYPISLIGKDFWLLRPNILSSNLCMVLRTAQSSPPSTTIPIDFSLLYFQGDLP